MSNLVQSIHVKFIAEQLRISVDLVEAAARQLADTSSLAFAAQHAVGELAELSLAQWYQIKVYLQTQNQLDRYVAHDQYLAEHFALSPRLKAFPLDVLLHILNQVLANPDEEPKEVLRLTLGVDDELALEAVMQEFYLVWFWQLLQQPDFLSHQRQFWLQHAVVELLMPSKMNESLSEFFLQWPSPAPVFKKLPLALASRFFELKKSHNIQLRFRCDDQASGIPQGLNWSHQGRLADEWLQIMTRQMMSELLEKIFHRELMALLYEQVVEGALPALELKLKNYLTPGTGTQPLLLIYPHGRSGVMLLSVDGAGDILDETMIYPYAPDYDIEHSLSHLAKMVIKHHIQAIALVIKPETSKRLLKTLKLLQTRYPDFALDIQLIAGEWTKLFQSTQQKHPETQDVLKMAQFVQHPLAFLQDLDISLLLPTRFHCLPKTTLKDFWHEIISATLYQRGIDMNKASKSELKILAHLTDEHVEAIISGRPWTSCEDIQIQLGLNSQQSAMFKIDGQTPSAQEFKTPRILSLESTQSLESIPKGEWFQGTVTNVMSYGVFVELAKGVEGLLHISTFGNALVGDLTGLFQTGELITVEWNGYDAEKKRLSFKYPYARMKSTMFRKNPSQKSAFSAKSKVQVKPKVSKPSMESKLKEPNMMQLAFAKLKGSDLNSSNK